MSIRATYLRAHPFVFAFALSALISGLLVFIVPAATTQSLTLSLLPEWIAYCWAAMSVAGGAACVYGILKLSPRYEGAGISALAATQLFSLTTGIAALGWSTALLGTVKSAGLALGLIVRAFVLARQS